MKNAISSLLGLALLTGSPALASTRVPVSFSFRPDQPVRYVSLVGDFNAWDATSHPLKLDPKTNTWHRTLMLPPGEHPYKFSLDGTLVADPHAAKKVADGFGHFNSAIEVEPNPTLNHEPGFPDRTTDGKRIYLRLNAPRQSLAGARVLLGKREIPMTLYARTASMDCFHLALPAKKTRYAFRVFDRNDWRTFGPKGFEGGTWEYDPVADTPFRVPEWAKGAVLYQIFPERFENGDKTNDPAGVHPWNAKPTTDSFHGGDLAGILKRFPHLQALGVDALYLNPVFEAASNHKYDTTSYRKIDPHFGDRQTFARLEATLKRQGMKLLLDGVFNHTGTASVPFQDVVKRGKSSSYRDWYHFKGFPVVESPPNYEAWWGYASLPKLNHQNPAVRQYFLGIGQYWLKAGADGWRLDVPNEVPQDFWVSFRQAVKKENPEALIIGEIWKDGAPWLDGKHFDSVMNYRFREGLLDLCQGRITARTFGERLAQ
ncbi:MAG: alpha-amylase family glycosyl hydrolase, partial [Bacteroidota bacterium]